MNTALLLALQESFHAQDRCCLEITLAKSNWNVAVESTDAVAEFTTVEVTQQKNMRLYGTRSFIVL